MFLLRSTFDKLLSCLKSNENITFDEIVELHKTAINKYQKIYKDLNIKEEVNDLIFYSDNLYKIYTNIVEVVFLFIFRI